MGLNLLNNQLAKELNLNQKDVQKMAEQLRKAVHGKKPEVTLRGEDECEKF